MAGSHSHHELFQLSFIIELFVISHERGLWPQAASLIEKRNFLETHKPFSGPDAEGQGNAEDDKPIWDEECPDDPGGGKKKDDDDDDEPGVAIPFGNYYLIFALCSILSLVVIIRRRLSRTVI